MGEVGKGACLSPTIVSGKYVQQNRLQLFVDSEAVVFAQFMATAGAAVQTTLEGTRQTHLGRGEGSEQEMRYLLQ